GTGGTVVRQRVRQADGTVPHPGIDYLDGGQRVVDGADDVGDGDVRTAECAPQHECGLELHERLDELLPRQGGALVDEEAGQQVPVVGLVETERVLHDLGDVAELVAD